MRRMPLTLLPLSIGLLACTGFCTGILEKVGIDVGGGDEGGGDDGAAEIDAPDDFKCSRGTVAGGDFPAGSDGWWRLDSSDAVLDKLKDFWKFPQAAAAMKEGDSQFYCDDGGRWSGPYHRETGGEESWVRGHYENGEAHGTWKGGSGDEPDEEVTFEGHYSYGQRAGEWVFYDGDRTVAEGGYREDRPHGDWTFSSETARHTYRYIFGTLHGAWSEDDPIDKKIRTGSYFNGQKHGVWIEKEVDEGGEMKEVKREVWERGTSRGADGRDPMEGADGARETLRAYLDADLAGGRLSSDGFAPYPVLADFADPTQFEEGEPTYDKAILIKSFTMGDVEITGATAKVKVTFDERCEVVAGSAVKERKQENEVEFTLKNQDGFWRIDTPVSEPHPSARAYLSASGGPGSDLSVDILRVCEPEGRAGKAGKAGEDGEEDSRGGKAGKGGGGGRGKGKGGKGKNTR
jgi:hypothetical protein